MSNRPRGSLLDLPLEAHIEICRWLDARTRWHISSSCRAFAAAGRLAPFSSVHAHIALDQVASFGKWLPDNGSRITALYIQGQALHSQHAKSALWAALSAPKTSQQLQHLQLDMPLSPEDEAAVLRDVFANAPNLSSLHLNYQRPLSHARKSNAVWFCAHSSAAPWAAAARQLRALRISGACFCNMDNIARLRGLTLLQVSCCNTSSPGAELAQLLQQLPHLQQLTYTSSAPAVIDYAIAAALAAHSSLTHLELRNFAAPASNNSSSSSTGAIAAPSCLGVAAGAAAASPAVVNALLTVALQRLQCLKLVGFSGALRLLPMLATASASSSSETGVQLLQLQLARSRQDGFMPALLAGMFSDSDSDSDSDSEDSAGGSNDLNSSSDDSSSDKDCSEDALDEAGAGCCGGVGWSGGCCGSHSSSSSSKVAAAAAAAAASKSSSSSLQRLSYGSTGSATGRLHSGIAPLALLHLLRDLDMSGFGLSNIGPVFSLTLLTSLKLGPGFGATGSGQHTNRLDSSSLAGIGALQQLQHLDVSHNKLTFDSLLLLQCLTALTYLSLAGNDFSGSSSTSCSVQSSKHSARGCSSKTGARVEARAGCCGGGSSSSEDEALTPKSCCSSSMQAGAVFATSTAAAPPPAAADCNRSCLSSNSNSSRTSATDLPSFAVPPVLFNNSSSSSNSVTPVPFARLRHLDVSGCGLSSIPGLAVVSGASAGLPSSSLTCLNAGTSLRHMGNGVWAKKGNQLTAACVANLAGLTNLQGLEIAANVPAGCSAGFRGLRQLTRLVVQDFAAVEGLLLLVDAPSSSSCSSFSETCSSGSSKEASAGGATAGCCFPHLLELGVMLRGAAGAAAMRQLSVSCRALRKLSIYQDSTTPSKSRSCCSGASAAAATCSSSSWHYEALAGLTRLQQLSLQPPADLRVLTGLTGLRHVQLLGPEEGWRAEKTETEIGQQGTAGAGAGDGAGAAAVAACCAGAFAGAGTEGLPYSAAAASGGGCCGNGVSAAVAVGGGGGGGACAGPCCGAGSSAAAVAAVDGGGGAAACAGPCCGEPQPRPAPAVAVTQLGARMVTDAELLGLSVMKHLTHLDLQHVVVSDTAVDELQRLLPCTRISV